MTDEIEIQESKRRASQIEVSVTLAQQINEAHAAYLGETGNVLNLALQLENRRIKLGTLIHEAKTVLRHGQFKDWIEEHCKEISYRSATRFMAYAKAADYKELTSLDNLKEYQKLLVHLGLKETEGHGPQTLHDWNAFSVFSKAVAHSKQKIAEVFEKRPLDLWNEQERAQLKEQLAPLSDLYYEL